MGLSPVAEQEEETRTSQPTSQRPISLSSQNDRALEEITENQLAPMPRYPSLAVAAATMEESEEGENSATESAEPSPQKIAAAAETTYAQARAVLSEMLKARLEARQVASQGKEEQSARTGKEEQSAQTSPVYQN
mgnify:CR=1 FL=1